MRPNYDELALEVTNDQGAVELSYNSADSSFLNVRAAKEEDDEDWYVFVAVAEFIRDDPLESRFRKIVYESLLKVDGVATVEEADREEWMVKGNARGEELVEACVRALKSIHGDIETYIEEST